MYRRLLFILILAGCKAENQCYVKLEAVKQYMFYVDSDLNSYTVESDTLLSNYHGYLFDVKYVWKPRCGYVNSLSSSSKGYEGVYDPIPTLGQNENYLENDTIQEPMEFRDSLWLVFDHGFTSYNEMVEAINERKTVYYKGVALKQTVFMFKSRHKPTKSANY